MTEHVRETRQVLADFGILTMHLVESGGFDEGSNCRAVETGAYFSYLRRMVYHHRIHDGVCILRDWAGVWVIF